MSKQAKHKVWQLCLFLVCIALTWMYGNDLGTSEFSGGRITGPILTMFDSGTLLFVAALIVTFFYPRFSAAIGVAASLLCIPLYFYFVAPGPFRWLFRGEYSVPLGTKFVWGKWELAGMLVLGLTAVLSVRNISRFRPYETDPGE
jgi:hypothetical protein